MRKSARADTTTGPPRGRGTADYESLPMAEALRELDASENGLSGAEARRRLETGGRNEITEKRRSPVLEFLSRFWGPMPWLLELAIGLSVALGHDLEAVIVAALVIMNAVIGFLNSRSSQRSLQLLKQRLAVVTSALRDGAWVKTSAAEIVPGDVVVVQMGDVVPADAKLLGGELAVDQSALTGESLPVDVHESGLIYAGSIVQRGEARCLVVNTGGATYFGRTAELVSIARPRSHQEQIMLTIVRYMMYLGIGALALVAIDALATGASLVTVVTFAVIFLMGAIPVALPAVLTIVQTVGAVELAGKGALVTRLDSIEDAASMDELCLDKTGTLTMNHLEVADVTAMPGYDRGEVVALGALTAKPESKDAIDAAVRDYAGRAGGEHGTLRQISVTPFEPATKRSEAIVEDGDGRFRVVKGAPQVVLSLCLAARDEERSAVEQIVEQSSRRGWRTLAVARSRGADLDHLELAGIVALADPARPDAGRMIAEAKSLGVRPLMVTGDNIAIAREMTRQLGLGDQVIRSRDLDGMSDGEQAKRLAESAGLAEVYPQDKFRIVKLLQGQGRMVGMTGDGVNDAPALKQAEIGIAVMGATDVAKASASIVLTEPGIRIIVDALKTSRRIYQRMLTWVLNKVTKTIQLVGVLAVGFFWLHELVVSLLGMALLVLANDFVTMSLATDNVKYAPSPASWNVKNLTLASAGIGVFFVIEGLLAILLGRNLFHLAGGPLRTFVLLMLVFTSQFRVYLVRERRHFWDSRPGRGLLLASAATIVAFSLLAVFGVIIDRIALSQVLVVAAYSLAFTAVVELPKYFIFRRLGL